LAARTLTCNRVSYFALSVLRDEDNSLYTLPLFCTRTRAFVIPIVSYFSTHLIRHNLLPGALGFRFRMESELSFLHEGQYLRLNSHTTLVRTCRCQLPVYPRCDLYRCPTGICIFISTRVLTHLLLCGELAALWRVSVSENSCTTRFVDSTRNM